MLLSSQCNPSLMLGKLHLTSMRPFLIKVSRSLEFSFQVKKDSFFRPLKQDLVITGSTGLLNACFCLRARDCSFESLDVAFGSSFPWNSGLSSCTCQWINKENQKGDSRHYLKQSLKKWIETISQDKQILSKGEMSDLRTDAYNRMKSKKKKFLNLPFLSRRPLVRVLSL